MHALVSTLGSIESHKLMVIQTALVGLCKAQNQTKSNEHGKEICHEGELQERKEIRDDGERVTRKHEMHVHVWIYSTRPEIPLRGTASNPIRKQLFPLSFEAFPCALVLFHLKVLFEMTVDSP